MHTRTTTAEWFYLPEEMADAQGDARAGTEASLGITSEDDCLHIINSLFPRRAAHMPQGRGDDCVELVQESAVTALSTDFFWQDSHFRTAYFTPEEAGAKALTVAVSDLAAAGAIPQGFSLALMLPKNLRRQAVHDMLSGMARVAKSCGIALTGGDISKGEQLGFSSTVWGKPVADGAAFLRRKQAKAGDCLFLVGTAGLARVGLWALENWSRAALTLWPAACAAHLTPQAHLSAGKTLAELAHAATVTHRLSLMDLSDGLMRDLPRLLPNLGATLAIPDALLHPEIITAARHLDATPEELILLGGEDFSLLGSCAADFWPHVQRALPNAHLLGHATAEAGITLKGKTVRLQGFDHFAAHAMSTKATEHASTKAPIPAPALLKKATHDITTICREAWQAGLLAGFNGNISLRLTANGQDFCCITRSGAAKSHLTEHDFALLSLADGSLVAGSSPSTEAGMHLAVYRACPDATAIMHTHPPYLLALTLRLPEKDHLQLPLPEAETYRKKMGYAPSLPPGTEELAAHVAKVAKHHTAVWMEHHGLVVHGACLQTALALTEELEQLAKVHLATLA